MNIFKLFVFRSVLYDGLYFLFRVNVSFADKQLFWAQLLLFRLRFKGFLLGRYRIISGGFGVIWLIMVSRCLENMGMQIG